MRPAPQWYSDTVSAVMVPAGINGAAIIARAFTRYNLALGAGLSRVAGKLFRIGHLGDSNELMLMAALAGAEMAMLDCGVSIEAGSGSRGRSGILALASRRRRERSHDMRWSSSIAHRSSPTSGRRASRPPMSSTPRSHGR